MHPHLIIEQRDRLLSVTLNRTEDNGVSDSMASALIQLLAKAHEGADVGGNLSSAVGCALNKGPVELGALRLFEENDKPPLVFASQFPATCTELVSPLIPTQRAVGPILPLGAGKITFAPSGCAVSRRALAALLRYKKLNCGGFGYR